MSHRVTRRTFCLLSGSALSGCGASLAKFPFDVHFPHPASLGIDITFYGVGCFLIQYKGIGLLTDPFWSYLPFRQVAFGSVATDPKQVDPYINQLGDVQAVLIGHNHYDHNLDLPYVADHLHRDAHALGSQTMVHTFAPNQLSLPMIALNDRMATEHNLGKWWVHPNKKIRVLAILSGHPNQYLCFHFFKKNLTQDRQSSPNKVGDYQEGVTMAFLVDFLDENSGIEKRMYIQTSSTGYPIGFFPTEHLIEHPIDVALLSMDSANLEMEDKYTIIDYLNPTVVLFCHWEDFFRSKDKTPREIVKVNLPKARAHFTETEKTLYLFPGFDSTFHL